MINKNNDVLSKQKNFWIINLCFWIAILFQLTVLNFIWSIHTLGRVANTLVLALLTLYAVRTILYESFNRKIWVYYILPGILIYSGVLINIGLQIISHVELVAYLGFLTPWAAYLAMPGFIKKGVVNYKLLWRYFYNFMLASIVLGLAEYLIFYQYNWANLDVLQTPNGIFLSGFFSIYHMLTDGTPHYRFYADFYEPGNLAMWLLPVICYAFLSKKYIGSIIFMIGFYLTDSLGGWISLLLLIGLYLFIRLNQLKRKFTVFPVMLLIFSITTLGISSILIAWYESKPGSAQTREDNITMAIKKMPTLIFTHPLGINLALDTASNMENESYIGSNVMPVLYFQNGGVLAFVGYCLVLFLSFIFSIKMILTKDLCLEEQVVFMSLICLLPFTVQRTTIFECSLGAFLFAPAIINRLSNNKPLISSHGISHEAYRESDEVAYTVKQLRAMKKGDTSS